MRAAECKHSLEGELYGLAGVVQLGLVPNGGLALISDKIRSC